MPNLIRPVPDPEDAPHEAFAAALTEFVDHPRFPCVGGKAAFHQRNATVRLYDSLGTTSAAATMGDDLADFVAAVEPDQRFVSFVAMFRGPEIADERHFESLLWRQLRLLAERDSEPWSDEVSANPRHDHFGFSFAGSALFVVGLHPRASRDARRAGSPMLVFNPHRQFERLRDEDRYTRVRDVIRRRDEQLQGTINPMVGDFGGASEARQYSGRQVQPDWQPPERIGDAS
jgi:FPC/CPF motif-containing protein YcgG